MKTDTFARAAAVAGALGLAGCVTSLPPPAAPPPPPTPLSAAESGLARSPAKDRVLWDYRVAAEALRAGGWDEARVRLDDALPLVGGILADDRAAARARSLFHAEAEKVFIGEPYERVMAYFYRAILYWRSGEPDNARACYRSGEVTTTNAAAEHYESTWVLLDYLDGLATARLGGDGSDGYRRARSNLRSGDIPPYDTGANVLVFAEFGRGPVKLATGQYGEELRFGLVPSAAVSARLRIGTRVVPLPAYDDLYYQATTRGGRLMDHILDGKAVFKRSADAFGDVALTGAAIAATQIQRPDGRASAGAEDTAAALGAIGLVSKVFAAATIPRADTRTWDDLPRYLSFAEVRLPPGDHPARVEYLDASGSVLPDSRDLVIRVGGAGTDTVVYLSELRS
jgi:hypothetical protein